MGEAKAKVILLSSEGCIGEDADLGFEILKAGMFLDEQIRIS